MVKPKIHIDKIKSEGYSFQVEINLKAHYNGMTIKEIPIILEATHIALL